MNTECKSIDQTELKGAINYFKCILEEIQKEPSCFEKGALQNTEIALKVMEMYSYENK